MAKMYPFSKSANAHDIEFRRNYVKNLIHDYESGETDLTVKEYQELINLEQSLTEIVLIMCESGASNICFLTGAQYGLAQETIGWAANERAARNN